MRAVGPDAVVTVQETCTEVLKTVGSPVAVTVTVSLAGVGSPIPVKLIVVTPATMEFA